MLFGFTFYNADNSCLFVNAKEIFQLKADDRNVHFPTQFCVGSISIFYQIY